MKLKDTSAQNSFDYAYLMKRMYKYIKPYLFRIILGFLIALPVGALDGVIAYALKPYMDEVLIKKNMLLAYIIPFGIVAFAALQGVLRYLNDYLTNWTGQKVTNDVKLGLFQKLVHMDSKFYDDNTSGIILTRYLTDPETASKGLLDNIKALMSSGIGAFALIGVMLYNSWELALVGVVVLCVAFLPAALIRKRIKSASNKNMKIGGNIMTDFNETTTGNKIVSAYNLADYQFKKFAKEIQASFDVNMSLVKRVAWMSPIMYTIASIGIALVMAFGTYLVLSGRMTSGSLLSFVTSLLLLYKPVKTLGNTLTNIQNIFVSLCRTLELFDIEPEINDSDKAQELHNVKQGVKLENVCFEYIKDTPVLKNINLEAKVGETVAIVGNSGGGKTTIANLIPRFYDVTSGAIKIDNVDIRNLKIESLRNNISVVFQDNFLFSGTIRENLLMGNFNATEDDIQKVVQAAHIDEFLEEMPDGLDSEIGERGTTLSGGQRQRVAIARAMLKDSPIVILDEATSALDNKSEAVVQKALDNLMRNKTVFVIAHRLSTIKNADKIAVINEGELVELGTHDELVCRENGFYKRLYEMQFAKSNVPVAQE
ncbi:MAG: ABC transporter ATP-binding protein [Clostridium sp.]|nr:ABC transporter ATP-binding protein [Clostridium sp.]